MVSSCRSSAPPLSPVNAVNDGLLPINICEDAQQNSGTYKKFPLHLRCTHVHVSFASVENSVMSVTKGFWGKSSNWFSKRKSPNCSTMLVINFSISWIYLESYFYFPQLPRKMTKFVLNDMFEDIKLFLERTSSSDQIKSSRLCFSPWSFTFK